MSAPTTAPYKNGRLTGTLFTFAQVGDILEMHVHGTGDTHITFVISGEIEAYGPERVWSGVYGPGAVLSFSAEQWHEFAATKPNTKILNILK